MALNLPNTWGVKKDWTIKPSSTERVDITGLVTYLPISRYAIVKHKAEKLSLKEGSLVKFTREFSDHRTDFEGALEDTVVNDKYYPEFYIIRTTNRLKVDYDNQL